MLQEGRARAPHGTIAGAECGGRPYQRQGREGASLPPTSRPPRLLQRGPHADTSTMTRCT